VASSVFAQLEKVKFVYRRITVQPAAFVTWLTPRFVAAGFLAGSDRRLAMRQELLAIFGASEHACKHDAWLTGCGLCSSG